ncbi:uncharacterized protein LOC118457620 [Anopheles albimanus]|uniref:Uncharacterized protein n=1 Tax=Anopheles albimanus TaxID=7167 RepID=A0A182FA67_ANOAL|nr:uncharacterized protein LOC118457620 [Anopheles albimanus]
MRSFCSKNTGLVLWCFMVLHAASSTQAVKFSSSFSSGSSRAALLRRSNSNSNSIALQTQPFTARDRIADTVSRADYMKSIPLRVLNCLEHVSIVECGKLYLLQNMESKGYRFADTGNLTHDVQQVLLPGYRSADNKLFSDQLLQLNGSDVNERLGRGLRLLFNERLVDLKLVPGLAVRLTPSDSNELQFSVRKEVALVDGAVGRDKAKKGIKTVLQLTVPLILLPSMLLAGVLPMILPVLKFATIFSSIVNHAALAAAIMYLAKQHAAEQESKQTVYFNAGYN